MRYYSFYPSCSTHGNSVAYGLSSKAVAKALDMDLIDLDGWNCCGSTPYTGISELGSLCCAARNLALAEKKGLDLVTVCSDCYLILNRANLFLKQYPKLKADVDKALAAGGMEYNGTTRVRHILDVFTNDISYHDVATRVKRNLAGLKVAPYYGCQIVRPTWSPVFDHPELPQSLERLIRSLGPELLTRPAMKTHCCGGSIIIAEDELVLGLIRKILEDAVSTGAHCIVVVCPLCQSNLDIYQGMVNKKFKTNFNIPIIFFTQLMGIALGIDSKALGLESGIVPNGEVLASYITK
jgi:heterodisulfide reductase subunit B